MKWIWSISDWHLREKNPRCRTDNFFVALITKSAFLFNTMRQYQPDIKETLYLCVAGDIFDVNPPSEFIKRWLIGICREYNIHLIVIFGQHDLTNHDLGSWERTGLGVIQAAGICTILPIHGTRLRVDGVDFTGVHFGQTDIPANKDRQDNSIPQVLMIHRMLIDEPLWKGQNAEGAEYLLSDNTQYDLILSGDNHQSFTYTIGNRHLINGGSVMRMTSAQMDHQPKLWRYDTKLKTIEYFELPINKDAVSADHISNIVDDPERMTAFVTYLQGNEVGMDIPNAFKSFFNEDATDDEVQSIIFQNLPLGGV